MYALSNKGPVHKCQYFHKCTNHTFGGGVCENQTFFPALSTFCPDFYYFHVWIFGTQKMLMCTLFWRGRGLYTWKYWHLWTKCTWFPHVRDNKLIGASWVKYEYMQFVVLYPAGCWVCHPADCSYYWWGSIIGASYLQGDWLVMLSVNPFG